MLPRRQTYFYMGYYSDMMEFLKKDIGNRIVYSFLFIAAADFQEAQKIMQDIRLKHPELSLLQDKNP